MKNSSKNIFQYYAFYYFYYIYTNGYRTIAATITKSCI